MLHDRPPGFWVAMSLMGMVAGTALGEGIAALLPDTASTLKAFFAGSLNLGVGPMRIDLVILRLAVEELGLKVNLMSFLGLILVGCLYRWF